jgi:hypothetical protein
VDLNTDLGTQDYHGLKLSFRRRAVEGVSLNGNYTWSHCVGNMTPTNFPQISAGYMKPDDPTFDRGNCQQSRDHIANFTAGYQTPQFEHALLRFLAADWRVSGIVNARSGAWLSVTQSIGRDTAGTGIQGLAGQPVNQVLDDPYGARSTDNYLNPAAFALPAPGQLGNAGFFSVQGPGFWTVDLAFSRLIPFGGERNLELRVEAFNVFNNFNWGNPVTQLDLPTFGRILSAAGDPRIIQFGIKYAF